MTLSISMGNVNPVLRVPFQMEKEPLAFLAKQMKLFFMMAHVNAVKMDQFPMKFIDFVYLAQKVSLLREEYANHVPTLIKSDS